MPPTFCASATTCSAMVVLPDDSGPKISEMRPRGNPPMPSAKSTEMEPVEIEGTACTGCPPSRMTEPLPNCFSIWLSVAPKARERSFSSIEGPVSFRGKPHYSAWPLRHSASAKVNFRVPRAPRLTLLPCFELPEKLFNLIFLVERCQPVVNVVAQ